MEVFVVLLEVLIKIIDPVSEDSDLNLRGTCITLGECVFLDDFLFLFFSKHINSPFL
jgi:hypothetical protein